MFEIDISKIDTYLWQIEITQGMLKIVLDQKFESETEARAYTDLIDKAILQNNSSVINKHEHEKEVQKAEIKQRIQNPVKEIIESFTEAMKEAAKALSVAQLRRPNGGVVTSEHVKHMFENMRDKANKRLNETPHLVFHKNQYKLMIKSMPFSYEDVKKACGSCGFIGNYMGIDWHVSKPLKGSYEV